MATKRTRPGPTRRSFRKAAPIRRSQKSAGEYAKSTSAFEVQQRRSANTVVRIIDDLRDVPLADFSYDTVGERSQAVTALNRLLASMKAEIDATKRRAAEFRTEEFRRSGEVYEAEKPARIRQRAKKTRLARRVKHRSPKPRANKSTKKARKPSKRKS